MSKFILKGNSVSETVLTLLVSNSCIEGYLGGGFTKQTIWYERLSYL